MEQWIEEESVMAAKEKILPSMPVLEVFYLIAKSLIGTAVPVWKRGYFQHLCIYFNMRYV